ncbi:MAG TPA: hypothetical protein VN844_18160 [Pyrinomonadaceae bacterium]|nr:hypothetical protein [Pyrinomonadaceae bacterium]
MHTNSPDAPNIHRRRLFSFFVTCLFIASLAPSFQSSEQPRKPPVKSAYDCAGKIRYSPIEGHWRIEQAIDDALKLLEKCESCRRMFSSDPQYAIDLLKRMRQDKVIIVSEAAPVLFKLSRDGKRLKVYESQTLGEAGAVTQDVADPKLKSPSGPMVYPCIYINPNEFIATDKPPVNSALYGLPPRTQRAVGILHELAHVARVIADDGQETEALRDISVASTNCVRRNCVTCEVFECPGAPKPPATRPKQKPKSNVVKDAGRARLSSPG